MKRRGSGRIVDSASSSFDRDRGASRFALASAALLLLLLPLVLLGGCTVTTRDAGPDASSVAAGSRLRRAIDIRYAQLVEARQLHPIGQGRNPIEDIVQAFVPVGMPLDRALRILRAAGFVVGPRERSIQRPVEVVVARIDAHDRVLFGFGGKRSVVISIEPSDRAGETTVGRLDADFVLSVL